MNIPILDGISVFKIQYHNEEHLMIPFDYDRFLSKQYTRVKCVKWVNGEFCMHEAVYKTIIYDVGIEDKKHHRHDPNYPVFARIDNKFNYDNFDKLGKHKTRKDLQLYLLIPSKGFKSQFCYMVYLHKDFTMRVNKHITNLDTAKYLIDTTSDSGETFIGCILLDVREGEIEKKSFIDSKSIHFKKK